ncbi:hypothetical protein C8Q74DRAFT_1277147, partial [Fomes fomentarius]
AHAITQIDRWDELERSMSGRRPSLHPRRQRTAAEDAAHWNRVRVRREGAFRLLLLRPPLYPLGRPFPAGLPSSAFVPPGLAVTVHDMYDSAVSLSVCIPPTSNSNSSTSSSLPSPPLLRPPRANVCAWAHCLIALRSPLLPSECAASLLMISNIVATLDRSATSRPQLAHGLTHGQGSDTAPDVLTCRGAEIIGSSLRKV